MSHEKKCISFGFCPNDFFGLLTWHDRPSQSWLSIQTAMLCQNSIWMKLTNFPFQLNISKGMASKIGKFLSSARLIIGNNKYNKLTRHLLTQLLIKMWKYHIFERRIKYNYFGVHHPSMLSAKLLFIPGGRQFKVH